MTCTEASRGEGGQREIDGCDGRWAEAKPLQQGRLAVRARQFSVRTEEAYAGRVRRYVHFHGRRDPRELPPEVTAAFLAHLGSEQQASAATLRQAASALQFLSRLAVGSPGRA